MTAGVVLYSIENSERGLSPIPFFQALVNAASGLSSLYAKPYLALPISGQTLLCRACTYLARSHCHITPDLGTFYPYSDRPCHLYVGLRPGCEASQPSLRNDRL